VKPAAACLLAVVLAVAAPFALAQTTEPATPAQNPQPTAAAAAPLQAQAQPRLKKDPFEPFNRSIFAFNDAIDTAVLKPVAQAYQDVVPEYVRTLVSNVFGNVADAWSAVNHFLQGKFESGAQMGFRVATNSVLGFGGLLDIGTEIGLEKQPEDLGQTLGHWGVGSGPYLVLPVLGPSTVRDTAALPADMYFGPGYYINDTQATLLGVTMLQVVSTRAGLLGASKVLDDVALDRYGFLRDAYLARRQNQVYDGNPPETPEEDEEPDESSSPAK
jgi:phospholipid-binding lipoprotein MlaA